MYPTELKCCSVYSAALKFCFKTGVAMKFVDDDDDEITFSWSCDLNRKLTIKFFNY